MGKESCQRLRDDARRGSCNGWPTVDFSGDCIGVLTEYALKAVLKRNASVGVCSTDTIVLALEKMSASKLQDSRYAAYSPEYAYPQGVYNPYGSQQFLQIYGVPETVGTTMYPYSQLSQTVPGSHSYTALPGYAMPGHQIVQFGGPSANVMTTSSIPTIPAPYPAGAIPQQPQFHTTCAFSSIHAG